MPRTLLARADVPVHETWALDHLFATSDDFDAAQRALAADVASFAARRGALATDARVLASSLDAYGDLLARAERLRLYATLPASADRGDAGARAAAGRFRAAAAGWASALAFVDAELLAAPAATFDAWLLDPTLARHRPFLERLARRRAHVRSAEVEDVLAGADATFDAYEEARGTLVEGDVDFGAVEAPEGLRPVAPASVRALLGDPDRAVRRAAFERWADGHLGVADTLADLYAARARRTAFEARVRGYPSAEASALATFHVEPEVLDATLEAFTRRLPVWHRYWAVRRRLLGVERLEAWDVFAPYPVAPVAVPVERAIDWIVASATPLGDDAVATLERGLRDERWVDLRPNAGKRLGAFCDAAPGAHPYVLLSYVDDLPSASTLAHEMGHALHAARSDARQMPLDGVDELSMTVAETFSNGQQALMRGYIARSSEAADPAFDLGLLDEAFQNLHRYLFVMPTLVRLERWAHARVEAGEPPSAEELTATLTGFFQEAYGPEVAADERTGIAWAEFPHLYAPFYTFQYAVGLSVALAQVARIEAGEPGAAEAYLAAMDLGASLAPKELFARLGYDVATPAPMDAAFDVVEGYVERLEAHAERLGRA